MNREMLQKEREKHSICQSGNLHEKSYILLQPAHDPQKIREHKGNQYEKCESLLINQLTQNSQSKGILQAFQLRLSLFITKFH